MIKAAKLMQALPLLLTYQPEAQTFVIPSTVPIKEQTVKARSSKTWLDKQLFNLGLLMLFEYLRRLPFLKDKAELFYLSIILIYNNKTIPISGMGFWGFGVLGGHIGGIILSIGFPTKPWWIAA